MLAALSFVALFTPADVLRWIDHRVEDLERLLATGTRQYQDSPASS